jgi:MFS family permease
VHVGFLVFCRYGPFLVGGLWGGVVADRFDNRRVLMASQATAMVAACGLAVVAFSGAEHIWLLYVLATISGIALVFDNPSKHALIYQLVGREELQNAVSLNISLQNAAKIVGPALGGVLIAAVGVGWCFAINAASFLATITALALMRTAELFPVERAEPESGLRAVRAGFAYMRRSRELLTICAVAAILGIFGFSLVRTLLSVLAASTLDSGPRTFGALFAAYGFGAVAGALANAAVGTTSSRGLFAGAIVFTGSLLALSPVHVAAVACGLLFLAGVGWSTWSSQAMAHVQLAAPDQLRGRVISLYTYTIIATAPIGALLSGLLADVGGTELAFAVAGGAGLAAVLAGAVVLTPNFDPQESPGSG